MTTRTSMSKAVIMLALVLSPAVHLAFAQSGSTCPLLGTKNGDVITIRAEMRSEPHDMALDVPGCDLTVLATFAGYSDSDVPSTQLRNDRAMKRLMKYTSSTYKSKAGHICEGCTKYGNVTADLTGKLEIAVVPKGAKRDRLGRTWDSSGKFIGIIGWGHPTPFADYRLVIESVSQVTAHRVPKPKL